MIFRGHVKSFMIVCVLGTLAMFVSWIISLRAIALCPPAHQKHIS